MRHLVLRAGLRTMLMLADEHMHPLRPAKDLDRSVAVSAAELPDQAIVAAIAKHDLSEETGRFAGLGGPICAQQRVSVPPQAVVVHIT